MISQSDHLTVICEPINVINNIPLSHTRKVTLRPITDSGKHLFNLWIKEREWNQIKEVSSIDTKVNILHKELDNKVSKRYNAYIQNISVLEQSCVVWNYNITKNNGRELE